MLKRALVILALGIPSLAQAASERTGAMGMQAAPEADATPAATQKPLAAIESLLRQLGDPRAAQASLSDVVGRQLAHLSATRATSLLRR